MRISSYKDLRVFQSAMALCLDVFAVSKTFPPEERFSLSDQIRRSSRSVCANLAEAWHKRRYRAALVAKLGDAESEAAETQVWIDIARRCGYLTDEGARPLDAACEQVISQLVNMIHNADQWIIAEESEPRLAKDLSAPSDLRPLAPSPPRSA